MSLKEEFKKPYNIIGSAILVVLIVVWALLPREPSEVENAKGLLNFFYALPREESAKVCEGLVKIDSELAGEYPELDDLKAKVRTKHGCD